MQDKQFQLYMYVSKVCQGKLNNNHQMATLMLWLVRFQTWSYINTELYVTLTGDKIVEKHAYLVITLQVFDKGV